MRTIFNFLSFKKTRINKRKPLTFLLGSFFFFSVHQMERTLMNLQIEDDNIYKEENINIKVMTYNIRHGRDLNLQSNLDRIVEVIKREEADVIALQEVDMGRKRTNNELQAQYIADKLNFYYHFEKALTIKSGGEYGNAIISRYPIQDVKAIKLPRGSINRPGRRETRNAVAATIITNTIDESKNFIFISTHLGIYKDNVLNSNRGLTARRLLNFIKSLEAKKLPIILAGDLNVQYSKIKTLERPDYKNHNVISNLRPYLEFEPYDDSKALQLDYILYRDKEDTLDIQCWGVLLEEGTKKDWISDHLAYTSVFSFRTHKALELKNTKALCK